MHGCHELLEILYRMKLESRRGWLQAGISLEDCEQVGAHVAGTAVLLMVLNEAGLIPPGLDINDLVRLALVHDLLEGLTGDFTPADGISQESRRERELDAIERAFPPNTMFESLKAMVMKTISRDGNQEHAGINEHDYVMQVDKLDMMLQALHYERNQGGDLSRFYSAPGKYLQDKQLLAFFEHAKKYFKSSLE